MDQLHHHRDPDTAGVGEQFRRALEGDEYAICALHSLAYLSDDDELSDAACRALRALGGPREDGRRLQGASRADQPWVGAVVDQLLTCHKQTPALATRSAPPIRGQRDRPQPRAESR